MFTGARPEPRGAAVREVRGAGRAPGTGRVGRRSPSAAQGPSGKGGAPRPGAPLPRGTGGGRGGGSRGPESPSRLPHRGCAHRGARAHCAPCPSEARTPLRPPPARAWILAHPPRSAPSPELQAGEGRGEREGAAAAAVGPRPLLAFAASLPGPGIWGGGRSGRSRPRRQPMKRREPAGRAGRERSPPNGGRAEDALGAGRAAGRRRVGTRAASGAQAPPHPGARSRSRAIAAPLAWTGPAAGGRGTHGPTGAASRGGQRAEPPPPPGAEVWLERPPPREETFLGGPEAGAAGRSRRSAAFRGALGGSGAAPPGAGRAAAAGMYLAAVSAGRRRPGGDGGGGGGGWHLAAAGWLLLLALLLGQPGTRALVCLPCDESKCEEPKSCPGSIVLGICGCCFMCARQRNESCGGVYGLHGACDRGLRCVIRPPLNGDSITEYEVGVCEGKGRPDAALRAPHSLPPFLLSFLPSLPLVPVPGAEPRTAPPCSSAQSCRRLGTGRAPPALRREDASAAPCLLRRCPQRVSPARERSGIETLCAELPASLRVLLCFAVFYPPRSTARASSERFRLGGEYLKVSPLVLVACSNVRLFQFRSLFSSSLVC